MADEIFVDDPEILQEFIAESIEHLEATDPLLIQLEEDTKNLELLNAVFRSVHSVKGSAGFLGLNKIQKLSHKMEGVLDDLRKEKREVTPDIMDLIFETSDVLKELIEKLKGDKTIDGFADEEDIKRYDGLIERIENIGEAAGGEKAAPEKEPKKETVKKEDKSSFESLKDSKKMAAMFFVEAEEHIENIEKDLLEIEVRPGDTNIINDLFRAFHSIKGSAAYVNMLAISEFSHNVENVLNIFRTNKSPVPKDILDLLFKSLDALKLMIEEEKGTGDESVKVLEIVEAIKQRLFKATQSLEENKPEDNIKEAEAETNEMEAIFLQSADQYIESAKFCLNNIKEGNLSPDNTEIFLRAVESLKKSAAFMNFDEVAKTAELIYDTLTFVKSGQLSFEKEILDLLEEKMAILEKITSSAKLKEAAPAPEKKLGDILVESGSVSLESVDAALEKQKKLGEILKEDGAAKDDDIAKALEKQKKIITANTVAKKVEEIKTVRVDQNKIDKFMNLVGELIITRNSLFYLIGKLSDPDSIADMLKEIKYTTSVIFRISDDLQTNVMKMRMVPIKTVFQRFPRMVRDIARNSGKKADIKLIGEDTEIDKTVAELLGDPLVHLVRNAIDHGIEAPEERIAKGKDETGTIILKSSQEGNVIIVEIIDDGAGMDPEVIKKKAIEKGIITEEEADTLSKKEAHNLIFRAGLSTAKTVTDISGRGVGMDVVKTNISKLKGRIDLNSDLNTGSKIHIELPLTLAIIKVLLIESKDEIYAMPLDCVVESVKVMPDEVVKLRGKDVICLRGEILGITKLSYLLGSEKRNGSKLHHAITEQLEVKTAEELHEIAQDTQRKRMKISDDDKIPVVILNVLDYKIGIVVDELHQQQEVVIKPMESYLEHIPGIGGATIMGDGRVVLILDPIELVQNATAE